MNTYNRKIKNRLKRADGQLNGVLRMMENNEECIDIVTQLTAVRSSLDSLIGLVVAENLRDILLNKESQNKEKNLEQAIKMIIKK
ncbi:metal-sensitive transcriptional regulator [Lactococcus formosensis]|uniref:metal-sensitive transcriptional regulator n=1 Tax=Lactococcus formosensis TaxID=1281486 RepID=UPI0039F64AA0